MHFKIVAESLLDNYSLLVKLSQTAIQWFVQSSPTTICGCANHPGYFKADYTIIHIKNKKNKKIMYLSINASHDMLNFLRRQIF